MGTQARRKEPERVRQALLDWAAKLAVEEGVAGVTVHSVARHAGVTKGGLFHHFPTKIALLEGLFADQAGRLDAQIDRRLAVAPPSHGCFTRAYIEAIFEHEEGGFGRPWIAISVAMICEPTLCVRWSEWLRGRLERHASTDRSPTLEIVRLAADGVWLSRVSNYHRSLDHDLVELKRRLLALIEADIRAVEG